MSVGTYFSGKSTLITGGTGFIGSQLVERLLSYGAKIHVVSRSERSNTDPEVQSWVGDLSDTEWVIRLVTAIQPEFLFHLAGHVTGSREVKHVIPAFRNNLMTSVNLMIAVTQVPCERLILAGSMEEPAPNDLDALPGSPYAAAKWASSAYGRMFYALYQTRVVHLRIFMVYGPGQRSLEKLVPYTILSLLDGTIPRLGSGDRMLDWIYVEDVIDALIAAATAPDADGATFDIGTGNLTSIRSLVENLVRQISPDIQPQFGAIPDRPLEQSVCANVEYTRARIGWRAKTSVDEGLQRTIEWYRDNRESLGS